MKKNIVGIVLCLLVTANSYADQQYATLGEAVNSIWEDQTIYKKKVDDWTKIKNLSYKASNDEQSAFTYNGRQ